MIDTDFAAADGGMPAHDDALAWSRLLLQHLPLPEPPPRPHDRQPHPCRNHVGLPGPARSPHEPDVIRRDPPFERHPVNRGPVPPGWAHIM